MGEEIFFKETQRFKQWWLWLILFGVNGLFLFGVFQQVILGKQFGDKPMSDIWLIIFTIFTVLFTLLFVNFRLETIVKSDGIHIRFFPFHWKFKHYPWDILTKSYVRKYSPMLEYGGWGMRSSFGKGQAYNVSGNMGLQLEFTNGKKLLIGTQKPEELMGALQRIGQVKQ